MAEGGPGTDRVHTVVPLSSGRDPRPVPIPCLGGIALHSPDPMPALRGGQVSPSQGALGNCPTGVRHVWWGEGLSRPGADQVEQPRFCDPAGDSLPPPDLGAMVWASPFFPAPSVCLGPSVLASLASLRCSFPAWGPSSVPWLSRLLFSLSTCCVGVSLLSGPEELSLGLGGWRGREPPPGSKVKHQEFPVGPRRSPVPRHNA